MRLSDCPIRHGGKIVRVQAEGRIGQRLLEMGFVEGADVRVIRVAPLGDPIEVEIQHYFLSLRKSEAALVEIAS
jgi:Fe2+ transport system protein FeoA